MARTAAKLEALVAELPAGKAWAVPADITDVLDIQRAVAQAVRFALGLEGLADHRRVPQSWFRNFA